jgi:hypothetical protein
MGGFDRLVSFSEPLKLTAKKLRENRSKSTYFEVGHHRGKNPNYPWINAGKLAFLWYWVKLLSAKNPISMRPF